MATPDKILLCRDCGREFLFSSGEQEFYTQRGYSEPGRCPECRRRRRGVNARGSCSQCGARVDDGQPMYCARCLEIARLEMESKLREEGSLRLEQCQEQASAQLLREIEIGDEEKPSYATAGLEEVSPFDQELRLYIEALRLREHELMESLQDRERQIAELSRKLEDVEKQNKDLALRLQITDLKLQNVELAAQVQAVRQLEKAVAEQDSRITELEKNQGTGFFARLRRWLSFKR